MIRRWYRALPERALWRIVEAPPEKWGDVGYQSVDGRQRCLVGHAAAIGTADEEKQIWADRFRERERVMFGCAMAVEHRFDAVVSRLGLDRARRLCQDSALKEILRRQPSPTPEKRRRVHV